MERSGRPDRLGRVLVTLLVLALVAVVVATAVTT